MNFVNVHRDKKKFQDAARQARGVDVFIIFRSG
jgi:hypothetical protein